MSEDIVNVNKLKFDKDVPTVITFPSDCIELPKDTNLETVIELINDLGISFSDKRNDKWKKYYVKKEFK